jgi:hypothetical protein
VSPGSGELAGMAGMAGSSSRDWALSLRAALAIDEGGARGQGVAAARVHTQHHGGHVVALRHAPERFDRRLVVDGVLLIGGGHGTRGSGACQPASQSGQPQAHGTERQTHAMHAGRRSGEPSSSRSEYYTGAGEDNGIDHKKNWLRFPYDSTVLRSHDLHPHPYSYLACARATEDVADERQHRDRRWLRPAQQRTQHALRRRRFNE